MAGLGLHEVVTHALIGLAELTRSAEPAADSELIRLANPVNEEHSVLRPSLYPSLLLALHENSRQRQTAGWLFEVGKCYGAGPDAGALAYGHSVSAGTGRHESWRLGIALLGRGVPRSLDEAPSAADVSILKGLVESLHRRLGATTPSYQPDLLDACPHLHPGRAAHILDRNGISYGWLGEVHPGVAAAWDLTGQPVLAELGLEALLALVPTELRVEPVPSLQPVNRDLAVVVDEHVPIGEVLSVVRANGAPLLVELELFDRYQGEQLGPGRVSYALGLRFQPKTASDRPDEVLSRIRRILTKELGAVFR